VTGNTQYKGDVKEGSAVPEINRLKPTIYAGDWSVFGQGPAEDPKRSDMVLSQKSPTGSMNRPEVVDA